MAVIKPATTSIQQLCIHVHTMCVPLLADPVFFEKYVVYVILTMAVFVGSQSFISLPSFMFFDNIDLTAFPGIYM